MNIVEATSVSKLLSDPTRLKILNVLFTTRRIVCVHEIAKTVGSSHSATSHQLAKLEARDVVHSFRQGKTICYEIQNNKLTKHLRRVIHCFK